MTSLQHKIYMERAGLLKENFGSGHDFRSLKPFHSYKTPDGHDIDVHVFNNPQGSHALFYNKNLNGITKLVQWSHGAKEPSKSELEKSGHENDGHENLNEEHQELDNDSAGKITEHSTIVHLLGHMHNQHNNFGSKEHKKDVAPHESAIKKLGAGKDPEAVSVRVHHGRVAADAALNSLKEKYGPNVKIGEVGHTSKAGDIGRFTKGKHNDGQENTSDVAVRSYVPKKLKEEISLNESYGHDEESNYDGFSLKSSKKSKNIPTKNPSIHVGGMLDHSTRKLNTDSVARTGLKRVHKKMGFEGVSAAERGRHLDKVREKEGVKKGSTLELKANELAKPVHQKTAEEFHDHLHHLLNHTGNEGHQLVGKMLQHHLTPETTMPYSKISVRGEKKDKVKATVTSGSESPLHKIFNDKKTKYAVHRGEGGSTVTISKVEKNGSHTKLAHYRPKTNSNAFKNDTSVFSVTPASEH